MRGLSADSPAPPRLLVHGAMALVALLFSLNYIISKVALGTFSPLTFAYLRVLGSAIVLNVLWRERDRAPLTAEDSRRLIGFALLGVVINQFLFLSGLALTSAHVAAILITLIPVFALGAAIALGREVGTPFKFAGLALSASGALLVLGGEGIAGAGKSLLGDLLIVGNSLSYALYLVLSKPAMARMSARRVISRMFAVAAVLMLPIAAWSLLHERWQAIPGRSWIALLLVILGPTVAGYVINAWALIHAESSVVATYSYLQPVITVLLAAAFLHERIRPAALVAGVMIVSGVYLTSRGTRPGRGLPPDAGNPFEGPATP